MALGAAIKIACGTHAQPASAFHNQRGAQREMVVEQGKRVVEQPAMPVLRRIRLFGWPRMFALEPLKRADHFHSFGVCCTLQDKTTGLWPTASAPAVSR